MNLNTELDPFVKPHDDQVELARPVPVPIACYGANPQSAPTPETGSPRFPESTSDESED